MKFESLYYFVVAGALIVAGLLFVDAVLFYQPVPEINSDEQISVTPGVVMDGYNAEFIGSDISKNMKSGETAIVSFTFKNTGDKVWPVGQNFYLGAESQAVNFYLYRAAVSKTVLPGDEIELKFLMIAPSQTGVFTLDFQMVQEGVRWFGDRIKTYVQVTGPSLLPDLVTFDKFDLQLSQNDLDSIALFKKKSTEAGYRQYEYNVWRKIKISYNGQPLKKAKLRTHGDTDGHFQSYNIKLSDGEVIDGKKQFRLILFAEREYNGLINYYFSQALDLMMLEHKLVLVSVNGGDYNLYYLRESKTPETLENNQFSNSAYIKRPFFDHPLLRTMVSKAYAGPGHRTFLDYEMSNQSIQEGVSDKQKVAYVMNELQKELRGHADAKKLLDFFDFDYLARFEAMRDLLLTYHDVDGDNLTLIYSEATGKFYPVPGGEIVYPYGSELFESHANRMSGSGDLFKFFSTVNKDPTFRQAKYKHLYRLISDENVIIGLGKMAHLYHKSLQMAKPVNYAGVEKSRISSRLVMDNINLLKTQLSSSNLLILNEKIRGGFRMTFNPISLSGLKIQKLLLHFEKPPESGSSLYLSYGHADDFKIKKITIDRKSAEFDIAPYIDLPLALVLTESLTPSFNETVLTIEGQYGIDSIAEIKILNEVTGEVLENDDVEVFSKRSDYQKRADEFLKKNFNYQLLFKNGQDTPASGPISTKEVDRLQNIYTEMWLTAQGTLTDTAAFAKNFSEGVSSLIGYNLGRLNHNYLFDLARYEISSNKIWINVLRKGSVIEFEILPVALADLNFTKFVLDFDYLLPKGQVLDVRIYDPYNNLLKESRFDIPGNVASLHLTPYLDDFDFTSERSEIDLIPYKYRVVLDFLKNEKAPKLKSAMFEVQNSITGAFSNPGDIIYAIGDGNDYFLDEKFFSPEETAKRYGIFEVDGDDLVLEGDVLIDETVIVPYETEVVIKPNTVIALTPGSSFVSYSPILAIGSEEGQISVSSTDTENPFGVFALAGEGVNGSQFDNFHIENGSEAYINGIFFSGMFDVYNAKDISVKNSTFKFAQADDALNFKYVSGEIVNSTFEKNASDGIDLDFVEGKIEGNSFVKNGGDGIDLSGSEVVILSNLIDGSGDKCISVGEKSRPAIVNNLLQKCKTGVAIKDLSYAAIANNVIRENEIGVNVYQKKIHFGPAHGVVQRTIFDKNENDVFYSNVDDFDPASRRIPQDMSSIDIFDSNIEGYFAWFSGNFSEKIDKDIYWIDDIGEQRVGLLYLPKHFLSYLKNE